MSRSNDVSTAMQYAKSGVDGVHLMDSHKATIGWVVNTLAAEVERLEKANAELIAETHRWSAADKASTRQRDEQRRELLQRAEAAEAQNARLRALAFELASSLGACAGYIASVRTDRQITQDENVYALQTLEWAEGAVEVAQYANAALEAYDKVTGQWSALCYRRPRPAPEWARGALTGPITCPKCKKIEADKLEGKQ